MCEDWSSDPHHPSKRWLPGSVGPHIIPALNKQTEGTLTGTLDRPIKSVSSKTSTPKVGIDPDPTSASVCVPMCIHTYARCLHATHAYTCKNQPGQTTTATETNRISHRTRPASLKEFLSCVVHTDCRTFSHFSVARVLTSAHSRTLRAFLSMLTQVSRSHVISHMLTFCSTAPGDAQVQRTAMKVCPPGVNHPVVALSYQLHQEPSVRSRSQPEFLQ